MPRTSIWNSVVKPNKNLKATQYANRRWAAILKIQEQEKITSG